MNKKIVCLVLALAMILTAGLALAAEPDPTDHTDHVFDVYDQKYQPWLHKTDKSWTILKDATCTEPGEIVWYCTTFLQKGGNPETLDINGNNGDAKTSEFVRIPTPAQGASKKLKEFFERAQIIAPKDNILPELPSSITEAQLKTLNEDNNNGGGGPWDSFSPKCKVTNKDGELVTGNWYQDFTCDESRPQYVTFYCDNRSGWAKRSTAGGTKIWGHYTKCQGHTVKVVKPHRPSSGEDRYKNADGTEYRCDQEGKEVVDYCLDCGKVLDTVTLTSNTHVWGTPTVYQEGNCKTERIMKHTCLVCGWTETYKGEKNTQIHNYGDWLEDPDDKATCTTDGTDYRLCSWCNSRQTRTHYASGHKPDKTKDDALCIPQVVYCLNPGCEYAKGGAKDTVANRKNPTGRGTSDKGKKFETTWYLKVDNNKHPSENLIAIPLEYVKPTCQEKGAYAWHCSLCCANVQAGEKCLVLEAAADKRSVKELNDKGKGGEKVVTFTTDVPKVDHVWSAKPIVTKDPTCYEEGVGYYYCTWFDYPGNGTKTIVPARGDKGSRQDHDIYMDNHCERNLTDHNHDAEFLTKSTETADGLWAEGAYKKVTLPKLNHEVDEWEIINKPVDGSTVGFARGLCNLCGKYVEINYSDAADFCANGGHPFDKDEDKVIPGKAATCTEDGYKAYYICSRCGQPADATEGNEGKAGLQVIKALGHEFDPYKMAVVETPEKAATCTEAGTAAIIKCARCDVRDKTVEEAYVAPLGHDFSVVKKEPKAATCTEEGSQKIMKCSRCDAQDITDEEAVIAKLPHDLEVTTPGKAATCTETGLTDAGTCKVCGEEIKAEEIPMIPHTLTDVAEVAATCTEAGVKAHKTCSVCKKNFIDEKEVTDADLAIAATGHKLTEVKYKDATCTEDGNYGYWECSVCGKAFVSESASFEITDRELLVIKAGHKLTDVAEVAATCTTDGVKAHQTCTVCEKNFVDGKEVTAADLAIKAAHTLTAVPAVEANCGKTGVKAHDHCSVCGKDFIDGKEVAAADLVTPTVGEHKYEVTTEAKAPTCTEAGYTKATKCTVCGDVKDAEVVPATGHKLTKVAEVPATCTTAGTKAYETCETCKKNFIDEKEVAEADLVIAALGHDFSVDVAAVPATNLKKGTTAGKKCSRCDVTDGIKEVDFLKGLFADADGKVNYYANGAIDKEFAGMVDFEGGKFYVKNGAVDTTLMGVSNVAYATEGVFYFFDHGQVQLNATGRASYDGEHFILKDGKVRLDYEGTYVEEGQTFWVSVGRICTELNGAHPEADGVYYYGDGRRVPCNGIAMYMGSYFYFENGKMVNATMQYVDFNGNAWNIVNGQAYPLFSQP